MIHTTANLVYVPQRNTLQRNLFELLRNQPNYQQVQGHDTTKELPMSIIKQKSVIGGVVNPWKWYVDFYLDCTDLSILRGFGNGKTDFKSVLLGMTHTLETVPSQNTCINWTSFSKEELYDEFMGSGLGYCAWMFKHTYQDTCDFYLNLNKSNNGFATLMCLDIEDKILEQRYQKFYDEEMIEWVMVADLPYIKTFGWDFNEDGESLYIKEHLNFPFSFQH